LAKGAQIYGNQIFQDAKLCVPEDRLEGILMAFDVETGHPGIDRLVLAAKAGHQFTPRMKTTERVRLIRRWCRVCQSCDSPDLSQGKPILMNPLEEGFGQVVVWIFHSHQWNGGVKIMIAFCFVLTAPRIGFEPDPFLKESLTGAKAAHLL